MRVRHAVLVALLPAASLAQAESTKPAAPAGKVAAPRQVARLLRPPDLERHRAEGESDHDVLVRLVDVLRRTPMGDAPARSLVLSLGQSGRGPVLVARGTNEQLAVATAALAALAESTPVRARLHCTLVRVPGKVARTHRLEPGRTVTGDGGEWAGMVRDAVASGGSVHNLPEVLAAPLVPFTRSVAPADGGRGARGAAPARAAELQVRGELVPLGQGEIAVALDVERERRQGRGRTVIAKPGFRLAAGRAAMMAAQDGADVLVMIVRCVELDAPAAK